MDALVLKHSSIDRHAITKKEFRNTIGISATNSERSARKLSSREKETQWQNQSQQRSKERALKEVVAKHSQQQTPLLYGAADRVNSRRPCPLNFPTCSFEAMAPKQRTIRQRMLDLHAQGHSKEDVWTMMRNEKRCKEAGMSVIFRDWPTDAQVVQEQELKQGGELPAGTWGMPPDGLCLSHACVAILNPRRFRRTPRGEQGTALRAGHVRRDQRRARQFLERVVRRMEALGLHAEVSRLKLSGVAGFPGLDDIPHFAAELGGALQIIPVTLAAYAPPVLIGEGRVVGTIGHVLMGGTGHFVLIDAPGMEEGSSEATPSEGTLGSGQKRKNEKTHGGRKRSAGALELESVVEDTNNPSLIASADTDTGASKIGDASSGV